MTGRKYNNILDAIGNTPLIKLNHITKDLKANIYAKLEFTNPGGSIKDRIALYMIEKAERNGIIKSGDTIVENSSGNTAMGLAIVCRHKGYNLKIVIRDTTSKEKIKMLEVLGVDVIKVDASLPPEHPDSYNNFAVNLCANDPKLYYIDQHNNLDNNETHYNWTGPEIWEQLDGRVDYLIGGIGTGGTVTGAGKFLREKNPNLKVIGIDPVGSIFYDYYKRKEMIKPEKYLLEGMGDEFLIKTAQLELLDDMYQVDEKKAFGWTKKFAFEEGIVVGGSSGANIWGAVKLAKEIDREANIVTILCDSGYKYFSTIYNDEWMQKNSFI
ncbi:MAG: cystathionine beta-synthase [Stygiobacter sp. RIFOXYC12_FULL_38_8]|nr:MAG: cystathionine beta-synthase [Stygiobacter sp. RIFOXYA12_FULL_38_9]OGV06718.1 MAG: cystathionine beta-synthase [Stygiobacter sp. RIFOXYB2_FULL_37_11]OGV10367.1 MAG: cystathionine beta-synthase [Stygiobacter sp. RIFOXYA2_FULL_38_8]OGV15101.1 MAG: cystathionine beta-synthase [Stygiobacter sp. RIFOXYC2_FULL_38_25]OGV23029.1 MAG: cystathionine beta-synthase [Stygiobacter sp. RIFOXYC12_FULL_38_8]OGV79676.1 MAG: cystathionine beta-synthase [Stygiobacter sp. GWF2_38_21]RJQ62566.1 MAG: cystein